MRRLLGWVALIAVLGGGGYYAYTHQAQVRGVVRIVQDKVTPCAAPLTYSIGSIDPRFGISKSALAADLKEAAGIWTKAAGKDLLAYQESGGDVTVSLVYDERQAGNAKLKKIRTPLEKKKEK